METIEQLLKQAEAQHKVIELNALFAKNMAFFKQALPAIYYRFKDYTPTEISLTVTDEGWVDMVNLNLNNKLVYGQEPKAFAAETVASYIKTPLWQKMSPSTTKVLEIEQESHSKNMNALIEYFNEKNNAEFTVPVGKQTTFLFMLGIGFGYQITELLKYTDIQHLVIAETNPDIFFASLHTLDWEELNNYFSAPRKTLNIIFEQTPERFASMLEHHINQIGVFNTAKPYVFNHLSSTELISTAISFIQNISIIVSSLGYFDDEKVGLTHTINNFRNKIPFLRNHAFLVKEFVDKPLFLIANGPSLDIAKDFIRDNQDKAILISCGTGLSSLNKLGIKPDFHVELERTHPIKEWIETTTTPEYRKGIRLLAINTVHPDLPKLFDTVGMALKFNDLGASYIEQFIDDTEMSVTLGACNPNVANAGLTFSAALGFTEIYLFGIDLGYPAGDQHHSSFSFHYDIKKEDIDSFNLDSAQKNEGCTVDGNFGGKVISSELFIRSRLGLESILDDCKEIKCYNTSNGSAIKHTIAKRTSEIDTSNWPKFNKKAFSDSLYEKNFTNKNFLKIPSDKEIVASFESAHLLLENTEKLFSQEVHSKEQAIELLTQDHEQMMKFGTIASNKNSLYLLKGSATSFGFILARCLYCNNDEQQGIEVFNVGRKYYLQYLKSAQIALREELLKNDYSVYNIKEKLK